MKIYLAAAYSKKSEMREHRESLEAYGLTVKSRWIDTDDSEEQGLDGFNNPIAYQYAQRDLEDIKECDAFVFFTGSPSLRGGRHVEFGYALGLKKPIFIYSPNHDKENIFHTLPKVKYADSFLHLVHLLLTIGLFK